MTSLFFDTHQDRVALGPVKEPLHYPAHSFVATSSGSISFRRMGSKQMLNGSWAPASPFVGPLQPHPAPVSPLRAHLSRRSQQGFARQPRGRIKRLDCSIGWRRKRCGCVSSVHIDNYRREGGRNHGLPGGVVHCIRTRLGFEPSSTSRSKHHLRIVPIETREIQHPLRIHARRLADRVEPGHFLRRQ